MKTAKLCLIILMIPYVNELFAQQSGDLDSTFGGGGIVTTTFDSSRFDEARALAIHPDGKIVVVGTSGNNPYGVKFTLVRYNTDGLLDNSFSSDGKQISDIYKNGDFASSVVLQPDGKIVVGGSSDFVLHAGGPTSSFAMARYNKNGSLDSTFGNDGIIFKRFESPVRAIDIQPDSKIIAIGRREIYRFHTNGQTDSSFNSIGRIISNDDLAAIGLQPDGKIVTATSMNNIITGNDIALYRYNADGFLDSTFGQNGKVITDFDSTNNGARSLVIQPNGKIVVGGYIENLTFDMAIVRYNPPGTLDSSFGFNGKLIIGKDSIRETTAKIVLNPDDKIVAIKYISFNVKSLIQINTDGTIDRSFGTNGVVSIDSFRLTDIAVQPDGKIVAVGANDFKWYCARYLTSGNIGIAGQSLAEDVLVYPNPSRNSLSLKGLANSPGIELKIFDMIGRTRIYLRNVTDRTTIDISSLERGFYITEVKAGNHFSRQKIIKE